VARSHSGALRHQSGPGVHDYLNRFGARYFAFSALDSALTLAAGLSLVRLRRLALYWFIAALAAYLLGIWLFQQTQIEAGFGSYSSGQEFAKVVFQLGAICYCACLLKRGILT
jgi:hypothetical protein